MKITVIVPVYNVEKYIRKCLLSLLGQTYKNIEILIVNDGTRDNSISICNEYASDKRIKILNKENGGLSSARNYGLKHSTGDYIMFVDSDDWLDVDCIEKCVEEVELENYDLVYFPYMREYEDGSYPRMTYKEDIVFNTKEEVQKNIVRKLIGPIKEELKEPAMMESNNTAWAKLYRASIIEDLEFTDLKEAATEDLAFNIKACKRVEKAKYITSTYYHYNKTNISSITKTETYDLLRRWKNLFSEIEKEKNDSSYSNEYEQAFNNRKIINLLTINMKVSMMDCSLFKKRKIVKFILSDEIFKEAFKQFQFEYLDFKWKLYYKFCQHKCCFMILIMLYFANKMKKSS